MKGGTRLRHSLAQRFTNVQITTFTTQCGRAALGPRGEEQGNAGEPPAVPGWRGGAVASSGRAATDRDANGARHFAPSLSSRDVGPGCFWTTKLRERSPPKPSRQRLARHGSGGSRREPTEAGGPPAVPGGGAALGSRGAWRSEWPRAGEPPAVPGGITPESGGSARLGSPPGGTRRTILADLAPE